MKRRERKEGKVGREKESRKTKTTLTKEDIESKTVKRKLKD